MVPGTGPKDSDTAGQAAELGPCRARLDALVLSREACTGILLPPPSQPALMHPGYLQAGQPFSLGTHPGTARDEEKRNPKSKLVCKCMQNSRHVSP